MNIQPATEKTIIEGGMLLRAGKLIGLPTETVYGLGADATNDRAVAEIFAVKGRPEFNPLIVHVVDVAMAKTLVAWNDKAEALAAAFWPGPLTLVLPRLSTSSISLLCSAGGDTLGVRLPAHAVAQAVIHAAGCPVAAPSANRSGRVSPTTALHVGEELGDAVPLIIDGGECQVGIESTVIDLCDAQPLLLRPGYVTQEEIEKVLYSCHSRGSGNLGQDPRQYKTKIGGGDNLFNNLNILKSPGQLASHYAPTLPVRLNVTEPKPEEALLAFGNDVPGGAKAVFNLSRAGDLKEAAAHLFAALRAHDKPDYCAIAVMPIPEEGLGIAINDRLKRAATKT